MATLDSRDFRASMSGMFKAITALVIILVAAVCTFVAVMAARDGQPGVLAVLILVPATLIVAALFRPVGYRLTDSGIAVLRPLGALNLPYDAIADVRRGKDWMRLGTLGLFRSGGFFGLYGIFRCSGVGVFNAYITDLEHAVMIRARRGRSLMISPDNPDMFISQLRERIAG